MCKNVGVHTTHCCKRHGCKYGDGDCPVENGEAEQVYLCEACTEEGIKTIQDMHKVERGEIPTCQHCGHVIAAST